MSLVFNDSKFSLPPQSPYSYLQPHTIALVITMHTDGARIIKHSPRTKRLTQTERDLTFFLKLSTPYIAALKRIQKMMGRIERKKTTNYGNVKYFTVKGMGKTMATVVLLAQEFNDRRIDVLTGSEEVVDEVVRDAEEDDENEYTKRMVSYIELRIWF